MPDAAFYRDHSQPASRRAYWRGVDAATSGLTSAANPYRAVKTLRRARRGSWSEAYTAAWAWGWREQIHRLQAAATGGTGQAERTVP